MKKLLIGIMLMCVIATGVIGLSKMEALADTGKFAAIPAYFQIGTTSDDLLTYKAAVERKIARLDREVDADAEVQVTVTFARPLTESELLALVRRDNLRINQIIGRAIERGSGDRAGFAVVPDSCNELFDRAKLEEMLERNGADLVGFIEARVYVQNRNLKALAVDELVFLADPSADGHLVSNPEKDFMPGVFWKLEDLGLVIP